MSQVINSTMNSRTLTEVESKKILSKGGLPVVPHRFCSNPEEAVHSSKELSFPLVVKMVSKSVVHKSDIGGVVLNIQTPEEIRDACHQILKAVNNELVEGFLIEEMVDPGLEFIIGSFKDESFGDLIMFGLGGVFTEVLKKFTLRSIPISEHDASAMVDHLKINDLLNGYRHLPTVDKQTLIEALLKIGGENGVVTKNAEQIKELDINPLIYNNEGAFIVDASIVTNKP